MNQYKLLFVMLCFCFQYQLEAQTNTVKKDSVKIGYQKIEAFSEKSKFSKFVHRLVFKPTSKLGYKKSEKAQKEHDDYAKYQGKIIRKVHVESLDPFGKSLTDSLRQPRNIFEKSGNFLHIKSREFNIKNLLLIKKNQPFDSLLFQESERLIRSQRFVRRIQIVSKMVGTSKDSVDVTVRVLDSWSLIPSGTISPSRYNINLNERNFLGWGHEFRNNVKKDRTAEKTIWSGSYVVPTIKNSFIRTSLFYDENLDGDIRKGVNIERQFFSPLTKYAGGVLLQQDFLKDSLRNSALEYENTILKFDTQDFWLGMAMPLSKHFNGDRNTNLVLKARYFNRNYSETASFALDSVGFYQNENFLLGSIGINSRRFYKDQFVFNYNIVEDIPIGKTLNFVYGYQQKNQTGRLYLGAVLGYGNYFSWGYMNAQFEYGTFLRNRNPEQGAYIFQINYFTNLVNIGSDWSFRFFGNPSVFFGKNRLPYFADQLTLNESVDGIAGFNNTILYGTRKMLVRFQIQSYSPWNFAGFRLNPFLGYNVGILGNETTKFKNNKAYSKISVGVLINNDYLIFGNFQLSFSYYTSIPEVGDNVFGTNSFNTEDFNFRDFEIGKPQIVNYR